MSIFQCNKCGCAENTALTRCYHCTLNREEEHPAITSYREIVGLKPGERFGHYCSACCPVWFTEKGDYGVGPNPKPSADKWEGGGLWHGRWERMFLPLGEFETNQVGNLQRKGTTDDQVSKWAIPVPPGIDGPITATEVLELSAKFKDAAKEPVLYPGSTFDPPETCHGASRGPHCLDFHANHEREKCKKISE